MKSGKYICTWSSSVLALTVTQPLSIEKQFKKSEERGLLTALALLRRQRVYLNAAWYAKYCARGEHFFKFMDDNVHNETCHTLPKTNEHDRRNVQVRWNVPVIHCTLCALKWVSVDLDGCPIQTRLHANWPEKVLFKCEWVWIGHPSRSTETHLRAHKMQWFTFTLMICVTRPFTVIKFIIYNGK